MSPPRRVVLVVGPPLAGVDGVVDALRTRLPDHDVSGTDGFDCHRTPDAVVAVVSAVAPLAASDWDLIARAATRTGLLVGAVSKIDAHLNWRDVLAADRVLVAGWAPPHRAMAWVGVAAAPHLGEPDVAALVTILRDGLTEPSLLHRSSLLRTANDPTARPERQPVGPSREEVSESRVAVQRVRLRLLRFVRDECASLRADLRNAAAAVPAGGAHRFETRVRDDVGRFLADLDEEIARAVTAEFGPEHRSVEEPAPLVIAGAPSASRRLETRLMAVLGAGFGLGIALASNRLWSGLAPNSSIAGWVAGGVIGAALVVWVVRTRGVLHDRALLDRWVGEVAATLRWHGEVMVAERLLTVESAPPVARRPARRGRKLVTDQ